VSCEDFKGSAHAFREFMRREQDAIERGERVGVSVKWASADPRQTTIGWLRGQWLTSPSASTSSCSAPTVTVVASEK
jgi:hypothetical protein